MIYSTPQNCGIESQKITVLSNKIWLRQKNAVANYICLLFRGKNLEGSVVIEDTDLGNMALWLVNIFYYLLHGRLHLGR